MRYRDADSDLPLNVYAFRKNNRVVRIHAESLHAARVIFQREHGYWPESE